MATRIRLDPIACDGYGYCCEILPELIMKDEWGYPIIDRNEDVPAELLGRAKNAIKLCPKVALSLVVVESAALRR